MSDQSFDDRLRCAAPVAAILDQVSAGRADRYDAHQAGCPHCQAALSEYARLWAPVREIAETEVHAPDSVLEDALRRIREAAADPDHATLRGPRGTTRISARVVVVTARQTAQDIAGVRVALSKLIAPGLTPTAESAEQVSGAHTGAQEEPRVTAGVSGRSTAIEVTLAADYGTDLADLAARLRRAVSARVRELTGLDPVSVNVVIEDVFDRP